MRAGLSRRISPDALRRPNETRLLLVGLCGGAVPLDGGPAPRELFLAYSNAVCAFDVQTGRLDACDVYTPPNGERVYDVAYCDESNSLFIATYKYHKSLWERLRSFRQREHNEGAGVSVRSLARTDGQWSECHRMKLAQEEYNRICLRICLCVLRDGTLLCSQWGTDGIHVCRANSDRSLQHSARVALPVTHEGFDAYLASNERWLAAALSDSSLALFRVDTEPAALVQLSRVILDGARHALFCGKSLLVGVATNNDVREAVSFTTTDGRLQRDSQLIPRDDRLDIYNWCFVDGTYQGEETLFAWDFKSKELLLFNEIKEIK